MSVMMPLEVRTFPNVEAGKEQALKPLEEAAEVYSAWQRYRECPTGTNWELLVDECADVVQSVVNLAAALGVDDLGPYMERCEERNRKSGRL